MAPTASLLRFHNNKPQSSGSVDSGGGAEGQTSLTSLLPPQLGNGMGENMAGSSEGNSGGNAMDLQGLGHQAEDVNKHREKNRNAQVPAIILLSKGISAGMVMLGQQ